MHWHAVGKSLARSGYIVIAPNFGGQIQFDNPADLDHLTTTIDWMRGFSPYATVMHEWEIGIAGHSYGGLLAMRYALRAQNPPVSAIAVIGSAVMEDIETRDNLREQFSGARLFCWGNDETFGQISNPDWADAAGTGHAVEFGHGNHWDFFPTDPPTLCAVGLLWERGPCKHTWRLTRDVVTVFFGKYLHSHLGPLSPVHLPASLLPPALELSLILRWFYGLGHLNAIARLRRRGWPAWLQRYYCVGVSRWRTVSPSDSGVAFFP